MVCIVQTVEIAAPINRCFDLARSIKVHLLGTERSEEQAVGGVTTGLIGPRVTRGRSPRFGSNGGVTRGRSPRFGSNVVIADAPLNVLPIYAHAGAIILNFPDDVMTLVPPEESGNASVKSLDGSSCLRAMA